MSGSDMLTVGIIGVGGIANGKHLPGLSKVDEVRLAAFCDLVPKRAEKGAAQYGEDDARVYTDYRKMLEECDLDVVHVCTPNISHSEITCDALEAGCHVLCEKPMAKTAAGARKMVETAKRTGKKLTIGYQNRLRPEVLHLKRLVEAGELGDIYYAKATALRRRGVPAWGVFLDKEQQGGGPLIDIGTHALDLTLWLMDNHEPVSAFGSTFSELGKTPDLTNKMGSWDPDDFTVEDSAFGLIKFKNGATVQLETSWALNTRKSTGITTQLCGTIAGADLEGGLHLNGDRNNRLYTENIDMGPGGGYYERLGLRPPHLEARIWIDAVLNDWEPLVKPEQACVVTEILEAIYTSAETGESVALGN